MTSDTENALPVCPSDPILSVSPMVSGQPIALVPAISGKGQGNRASDAAGEPCLHSKIDGATEDGTLSLPGEFTVGGVASPCRG